MNTVRSGFGSYQGTALQAAEKVASRDVLKGHGFSRAVQVLSFCHPERTLVREGSAFPTFCATSEAGDG